MIYSVLIISSLITSWSSFNPSEESVYFDAVHNKRVISSLVATKTIKGAKTYYQSSTTIETRIIKDIRVNYMYDVVFDAALLEKADVHISVNEKPHAEALTQWTDPNYQIIKNDEIEKTVTDSISFATIQLFFKEPVDIKPCYSEQNGSFNTIIAMGNHKYEKVNSKGNENIYYYEAGVLIKATIHSGVISFEIIAKNED